jgi:hypothetical protein
LRAVKAFVIAVTIVGVLGLLAGCGDDDGGDGGSPSSVSEQDVVQALGLVPNEGGKRYSYSALGGRCKVTVVLTSPEEVDLYAEAGDPVAQNSDGTVGLKVGAEDPSTSDADCVEQLSAELDDSL